MKKFLVILSFLLVFFTFNLNLVFASGPDSSLLDKPHGYTFQHRDFGTCKLFKSGYSSPTVKCSGSVPYSAVVWANLSDKSYIVSQVNFSSKVSSSGTVLTYYSKSGAVYKSVSGSALVGRDVITSFGNKNHNAVSFTSDEGIQISRMSVANSNNNGFQVWFFNVSGIAPDPEPEPVPPASSVPLEFISKLDEILQELKKKNSCDVCKKLDALLADTNAINNNISQIKITTGYMNGHLKNISSYLDRLTSDSFLIREYVYDIRNGVFDIRDSVSSIDTKLDDLGPIKNTLLDISDKLDPTVVPDFSARVFDPGSLPSLNLPDLQSLQDNTTYFSDPGFDGESEPLPFSPKKAENWRDDKGNVLNVAPAPSRDKEVEKDSFLQRDQPLSRDSMQRDQPLSRDPMQRDQPLGRDFSLKRDNPLQRDEVID